MRSLSVLLPGLLPGLLLGAALPACAAGYRPGSFTLRGEPFVGATTTAGCLDLAVAVTRDPVATGPVVGYHFGNRCDRPEVIDLKRVAVTGRTPSGEEVPMVPYDPYGQILPLPLDARTAGRERIEYRTARDFSGDVIAVCVAIGGIGQPGAAALAWTCHDVPQPPTPEPTSVAEVTP